LGGSVPLPFHHRGYAADSDSYPRRLAVRAVQGAIKSPRPHAVSSFTLLIFPLYSGRRHSMGYNAPARTLAIKRMDKGNAWVLI
jgi:hypothetical protein